ncbi:hypothetical protein Kpol_1051p35 [Vanderwaltozyma polyspora DSM 70294]|uniref:Uncharacterized protein n=1 Tax=Vanderwaltozyma polyspora (strain ATCC 22028 / DSM 70294 / BCRC 21397 / CBS 2163 / NBRC 10782 / NRRL Y-8283 / UCD 57-17) TaxID=436907 RepID=A7TMZ7_VANPO|nr:uncharacterized protein Kpol_1051p35 [Vanderwaltozyma polyspora DSM 70294]EDO16385.1 hypothetical protein Kpol_1051p35 [Vanderwaltozyma polyspora DSM 70294]
MDRVRDLLGGHHRNGDAPAMAHDPTNADTQNPNPNLNSESYVDDQYTVIEGENFGSDNATIHTFGSQATTIGDLQRNGFVNRCPRFNYQRKLPFISILLTKGFFCFPSEKSYRVFLENKRKFDFVDVETGMGIPLYQAISQNVMKSMFSRNDPVTKIYKYILINPDTDHVPEKAELIAKLNTGEKTSRNLYKFEFCSVYKDVVDHYKRIEHRFTFFRNDPKNKEPLIYTMVNHLERRNTDTQLDGLNLQWYGTTGFASPFGSNNFKLLVLDDNMPSMCDQKTMEDYDAYSRSQRTRPLGHLPVWARYSDDNSYIPKKRTLRIANFEIGEVGNSTLSENTSSEGIFDIPWDTEVLTCMAMVLHIYESRKDKRHGAASGLDATLLPTGLLM